MSALKRNKKNAINGKQKDIVQKEMLAVSATMRIGVEKKHNRPLLLQNRRHRTTKKLFERESLPEAAALLEGDPEYRAETTSAECVRIRPVIFGIRPNVNITKRNRDANSVKSAYEAEEK